MSPNTFKFGQFELDGAQFELRRGGRSQKIERIPLELLILLAERNGQVVSRQDIVDRLWGKDVFLDTEHGINTAVRKIRAVLRDDVDRSRYIQTVSGKGYRFIAKLEGHHKAVASATQAIAEAVPAADQLTIPVPAKRNRWKLAALSVIAILLVVSALLAFHVSQLRDRIFAGHQIGPIRSIAVLPLTNLSGDTSQDYYADGMTDELVTALAQNRSLRVVSRTSAMQYKGVNKPLRDIAQALGVDGILEGSVNRSSNHVHVNLQLIYALTDTHVWAQSYDRDLDAAMSLPEEVSQTIAAESKVPSTAARPQRHIKTEAHDAYLQGRFYWFMGDYKRSKPYFEKATQVQPDYAVAWDGLADYYAGGGAVGELVPSNAFAKSEEYVRKALALDESLPEAHNSLAAIYLFSEWDWRRAEQESLRAIELSPNFAEAHHIHSYILFVQNRDTEALQEEKISNQLDPLTRPGSLGLAYLYVRQFDNAIADFEQRAQFRRNFWAQFGLSEAYQLKGDDSAAAEHVAQAFIVANDEKSAAAVRLAFKKKGIHAVWEWMLSQQMAKVGKEYVSPWTLAWQCAQLKNKERTLSGLDAAYKEHSPSLVFLQKEPVFDFLHSDPRYRALIAKIGLPVAY